MCTPFDASVHDDNFANDDSFDNANVVGNAVNFVVVDSFRDSSFSAVVDSTAWELLSGLRRFRCLLSTLLDRRPVAMCRLEPTCNDDVVVVVVGARRS